MNYVCSNCRAPCGKYSRMGMLLDIYLTCPCSYPKNRTWINDDWSGYHLNDAYPVIELYADSINAINELNTL